MTCDYDKIDFDEIEHVQLKECENLKSSLDKELRHHCIDREEK